MDPIVEDMDSVAEDMAEGTDTAADDTDCIELTEQFLYSKVVTPIVLGLFANDEWDSMATIRDPEDPRRLFVRVVVCEDEAVNVLLDFPGNDENINEMQMRLIGELKAFIASSEFGARRTDDWTADEYNDDRRPAGVIRTPRPNFLAREECKQRCRRNAGRVLRIDRRRCLSTHRRG
ncbi:hypothetical protein [Brevibacterium oceani]|uniref:hypothetical protein n=1 Tax=Brevibacterium oceani TaxID=358099 RepID=UPI0015E6B515|nr:hypothetical protein [Brevibacterium oceani]